MNDIRILKARVDAAEQALLQGGPSADNQLVFLGERHDAYPVTLIGDQGLTDSAKIQYLYLTQAAARNQQEVAMPPIADTALGLGQSQKTVSRDRLLLRLRRWITLAKRVRDPGGRHRGALYVVHATRAELETVLRLDSTFMSTLEAARGHADPYVRAAANVTFEEIERAIREGRNPLEKEPPEAQLESLLTCTDRANRGVHSVNSSEETSEVASYPQKAGKSPAERSVHTVNTPEDASERPSYPQDGGQSASDSPRVKFTHGGPEPCVNFTRGDEVIENTGNLPDQAGSGAPRVKFTRGDDPSSSSKYKTTTTTSTEAEKNTRAFDRLRWPEALDDNIRRLVGHVLDQHAPPGQAQDILDALALKLRDARDPVRSPMNYVFSLCERARRGAFVPPMPPNPADGDPSGTDASGRRTRVEQSLLAAEIQGLERLRDSVDGEAREALENQIRKLRQRIESHETVHHEGEPT